MILITPAFKSVNPLRAEEYKRCLHRNLICSAFEKVIVFKEDDVNLFQHPKLVVNETGVRTTYASVFAFAQQFQGKLVALANSDIYFDKTSNLEKLKIDHRTFVALTRHDGFENIDRHRARMSQDVWIVQAPVQQKLVDNCDFFLGLPGCDNRVAYEAKEAGYEVINPALAIKSYHLHKTAYRTYTTADMVAGPHMAVPLTGTI